MITKVTGNGTQPDGGVNPKGVENVVGDMTEQEKKTLTNKTAESLLAQQADDAKSWMARGKVIAEYADKIQPNKKNSRPDPFQRLAQYPEMVWSANQLRTYAEAYRLWTEIGGEAAPKLRLTVYSVVLRKGINRDEKLKYLQKAAAKGMSVRDLKSAIDTDIARRKANRPEADTKVMGDWKVANGLATRLSASLAKLAQRRHSIPCPDEVKERLAALAKTIATFEGEEGGQP
jgi:hypothetical protein